MTATSLDADILVRPATKTDRPHLLSMLSEFADYLNEIEAGGFDKEKLEYLVDLSVGPDPVCNALIAELNGVPAGYVAFHLGVWETYKALYVVSLFVRPKARRAGIGKALMLDAQRIAKKAGAERVVWFVWKKNRLALEFYSGLGAVVHDDNHLMAWAASVDAR